MSKDQPTLTTKDLQAPKEAAPQFQPQAIPVDQFTTIALSTVNFVIKDIDGRDKVDANNRPVTDGVLTKEGVIASYKAFAARSTQDRTLSADEKAIRDETIAVLRAKLPESFTISPEALTAAIKNVATTWDKSGDKKLSPAEIDAGKGSGIDLFTAVASVSPRGNEILGDLQAIQRSHLPKDTQKGIK